MNLMTSKQQRNSKQPRPLPRVRREYPTVQEAVAAAEGLTTDPKVQAEIAAGLMGVSEDEVRPHIFRPTSRSTSIIAGRRTVVVERRRVGARAL